MTCGECSHYKQLDGRPSGECYLNPPAAFPGGWPGVRPIVGQHDRQCSHFHEVPAPVSVGSVQVLCHAGTIPGDAPEE